MLQNVLLPKILGHFASNVPSHWVHSVPLFLSTARPAGQYSISQSGISLGWEEASLPVQMYGF